MFVPLLKTTAEHFDLSEVSADRAGATPFIPFKTSMAVLKKSHSIWARIYHPFVFNRETYLEHFHERSNIETAYSMIKGKFGSALRSKSDTGQINEALCKVLAHNICVLIHTMHTFNIHPILGAETRPAQKTAR